MSTVSPALQLSAALLAAPFVLDAIRRIGWSSTSNTDRLVWCTSTLIVILAHRGVIETQWGYHLHYLGGAALPLLLGYPRAVLSMLLVVTVDSALGDANLPLGLAVMLGAVLPAWLTFALYRLSRRWLPPNPFVFLFGCGFIGLFVVYAVQQSVSIRVWTLLVSAPTMENQLLTAYALLLAWGETLLEGMVLTVMVVYLPGTVRLFDDRFYLFSSQPDRRR